MATLNGDTPKITLYTNHSCPWAHRSHIVLRELGLPFDEVIIDLGKPREPWYLEVNPRGLVPSIKFSGGSAQDVILTESAVVSQFLADAYPSHLVPTAGTVDAALTRARINFFVDAWTSKAGSYWIQIAKSESEEEKEALVKEFVSIVGKEIEPLLKDAKPYFGGSERLTMAEALTAPFILRIYSLVKGGVLPQSLVSGLNGLPNFTKWATEVIKHDSVTYIWNEHVVLEGTKKKLGKA
ncbi:thioredoxin-like protein [Massariosphaeria phaeospora]|uniref:Thioredoxin-like protein n=1 Tax=Massariosphaeria phaeospora TaxID=100035 RepID=A0A7C8I1S1_9PLEO|nr:thioredoxin-like protein [Massariosphaeria phaeospora]